MLTEKQIAVLNKDMESLYHPKKPLNKDKQKRIIIIYQRESNLKNLAHEAKVRGMTVSEFEQYLNEVSLLYK